MNLHPVKRGVDIFLQPRAKFLVSSGLVAEMGEVSPFRFQFVNKPHGLLNGKMGEMISVSQSVYYQNIETRQFLFLTLRDMLAIGHVCEIPYSESENRKVPVFHFNRCNPHSLNEEWIVVDNMHIEPGDSGIFIASETIVHSSFQVNVYVLSRVDGDVSLQTEWAQVVESSDMVVMYVGDYQRIYHADISLYSLLSKIGRGVDEKSQTHCLDQNRTPCAFVSGIFRTTHMAVAAYLGDSLGCPGSQHSHLYGGVDEIHFRI